MAGFVGAYAGKYLGVPSVVSIRGNDIERAAFDPGKFSHIMFALQHASAITTNARVLAGKAKAFFDREIHVIPNGVDTKIFKAMKRNEILAETLNIQLSTFTIGFVGELREKKGLTAFLTGFARAARKLPVSLLIVGEVREGEDKKRFDDFRNSNPEYRIIVTGQVAHKDLPAYYSLMDVFVHPSLRDGMPNAVLEAMACEIPVIATPVGGMPDVIQDGKNGAFVNVGGPDMLAGKILDLLGNPNQRAIMGRNARQSILEKFTPEKELQANLSVYQSLGVKT
jgi:glycosyltransferase involved in cell wall biosynthesis